MTNPKDGSGRKTPDEREFLSREGHALHRAEEQHGRGLSKQKLLWIAISCFLLAIGIAVLFWYINRR